MIAIDLGQEILVPAAVTLIGAVVAGLSAAIKSWFENRGARRRAERQIELADKRTKFVGDWVQVSDTLKDPPVPGSARARARGELDQAFVDAQRAYDQAKHDTSTVFRQFRGLLMLVRRRNPASYVVSGLFLFVAVFVWLLLCIPDPSDDSFSIVSAVLLSLATTLVLRAVAEIVINLLEHRNTPEKQTVSNVAARSNTVTITTAAPHGLRVGDDVVVDVTKDVFDGTFTVTSKPTDETFTVEHRVADTTSAEVRGWVCGDGLKVQMRQLLMIEGNRGPVRTVIGGLFLAWLLFVSMGAVIYATSELDADEYPSCIGTLYRGAYFGVDDGFLDEDGALDVELAVDFLERLVPLWSPEYSTSGIEIVERTWTDDRRDIPPFWTLTTADGDEYRLDEIGLYYADASTVLHAKTADNRLGDLGDPCDPQEITVHTVSGDPTDRDGLALFTRFDPTADETGIFTVLYEGEGENEMTIEAYFGRDGRMIPVCDPDGQRIQPCIARQNVYYDSGLDHTLTLLFETGLMIIGYGIVGRLVLGLIRSWFDRRSQRTSKAAAAAT